MINVYIGYDTREDAAYKVCRSSLVKNARGPLNVVKLRQDWLRRIGLYRRQFYVDDGQYYDTRDGRPFSTEFSFTRFLVPSLQPEGLAVFCDSDFLWRADVYKLIDDIDPRCAISVVKHQHKPDESTKMRGQVQHPYYRKNWSSLVVWNCDHYAAQNLTPYQVNHATGAWLHQFAWLDNDQIGEINQRWNWLDGHSPENMEPAAVHYTRGTPDMPGWENTKYANEWLAEWGEL